MLHNLGRKAVSPQNLITVLGGLRCMTSTEISTALKPFYFSVHPDLFGKYPTERSTNENSLKKLSLFIESLQSNKKGTPCNLQFYIRDKKFKGDSFRLIKINLKENDLRGSVLKILKSCDLSTEYVDKIAKRFKTTPKPSVFKNDETSRKSSFYYTTEEDLAHNFKDPIDKAREALNLKNWIDQNHKVALKLSKSYKPVREEIIRLMTNLRDELGLLEIRWECGWNEQHFRGCLQSLQSMVEQNPEPMYLLKGRVLVFAPFTGVNLEGHIMLSREEVRHNWLDFIKNVKIHDQALLRIPAFERSVSQVLRNIQVVRRKFMPKILADEYELNLQQFTTNVSDYLSRQSYPNSWPLSLENYEIVIETEAGPLMVSPTGQFIAPSSCPGFLLVNFISDNMEEATEKIANYKRNKHIERAIHSRCISELSLTDLIKTDNVTPDLMIACCNRLLEHKDVLGNLNGILLNISNYYSVLDDGTVCIPWNWNL